MVNAEFLNELACCPERMNSATLYQLRTIVARYPYFQKARLLLLCNLFLLHDPDFNTELRRSVFYIADRRELWRFVNGLSNESQLTSQLEHVTTDEVETEGLSSDRTLSLIDDFLKTMPEEPERLVLDTPATTDYLATLGWTMSGNSDLPDIILPSEATESPEKTEIPETFEPSENEEKAEPSAISEDVLQPEFLTETLARIYIKQKKYDRALAIIRSLYLNFPEKSIYFADQIRFLEKLVRNNQSKKVK